MAFLRRQGEMRQLVFYFSFRDPLKWILQNWISNEAAHHWKNSGHSIGAGQELAVKNGLSWPQGLCCYGGPSSDDVRLLFYFRDNCFEDVVLWRFYGGYFSPLFYWFPAIENLPAELGESLTTVRQLDLLVQSMLVFLQSEWKPVDSLESLHEVTKAFFEDCKYDRLSEFDKSMQHSEMLKEYDKALAYCREKREIVEKIYTTVRVDLIENIFEVYETCQKVRCWVGKVSSGTGSR